jgi:hypothetical protein
MWLLSSGCGAAAGRAAGFAGRFDRVMVTTGLDADKYRITSRDIPIWHGYTIVGGMAAMLRCSIAAYENCQ